MGSDIEDRYVHAALKDYLGELLLPEDFLDVDDGKTGDLPQVFSINDELDSHENRNRRFLLGVFISFVSLAEELCRQNGVDSIDRVLTKFPPRTEVNSGKANSLTLGNPELSLRTYYNAAEKVIRHDLLRSDYPNCARTQHSLGRSIATRSSASARCPLLAARSSCASFGAAYSTSPFRRREAGFARSGPLSTLF